MKKLSNKPNVGIRKKKRKWTLRDSEKLHERLIDIIDKLSLYRRLPAELKDFYKVWRSLGCSIKEQLSILEENTGEAWNRLKYDKVLDRLKWAIVRLS